MQSEYLDTGSRVWENMFCFSLAAALDRDGPVPYLVSTVELDLVAGTWVSQLRVRESWPHHSSGARWQGYSGDALPTSSLASCSGWESWP